MSSSRIRGIVMMIVAVAVFAVMDSCLKIVSSQLLPLQVATLRAASSLPFVLLGVAWAGRLHALRVQRYGLHLARGVLSVIMIATYSYAVGRMSLSGVYTVFMVAPLMVTAVSVPVFGEAVRPAAWLAILAGLAGVIVVLGPSSGALNLAGALAALASACCYTINYVLARKLAPTESTDSLVFWVLALMALISGAAGYGEWQPVPKALWPAIVVIGLTGAVAQLCITRAFLLAPASVIAPFEYTALVWAVLIDWFVWHTRPTLPMLAGAALIVGSGVYVMLSNAGSAPAERLAAECDPHP
jgi:drug/metabolite transporter (DMT)-like permease